MFENMTDVDKKVLKQDMEYHENWHKEYKKQLDAANSNNDYLHDRLIKAEQRLYDLEHIFYANGCTSEQLEEIIKQTKG